MLGADRYLELMSHDKKVLDGKMRLVLLQEIGKALLSDAAIHCPDGIAAIEARCTQMGKLHALSECRIGALQHLELTGVYQYI